MAMKLFKRGQAVLLMLPDGGMRMYADAVRVARVMKDYPGFMVGSHNSARLHLPPEKLLRPGNSYFLHAPSPLAADALHVDGEAGFDAFHGDGDDESSADQQSPTMGAIGKPWMAAQESRRFSVAHRPVTAARPSAPSRANSAPRYSLDVHSDSRGIRRSFSAKDLQDVPVPVSPPPAAPAPAPMGPPRPPASRLGMRRSASAQNLAQSPASVELAVALYSQPEHPDQHGYPHPPHAHAHQQGRHASMDSQSQLLSPSQTQRQSQWDGSSRFAADAALRQHCQWRGENASTAPAGGSSSGCFARPLAADTCQPFSSSGPMTAGRLTRRASLAMDMSALAASPSSLYPPPSFRRLPPDFQAQDASPTPAVPSRLLCAGDVRIALGGGMSKSQSYPDFRGLEGGDVAQRAQPGPGSLGGSGSGEWGSGGGSPGAIWEEDEEDEGAAERSSSNGLGRMRSGIPSRYAVPEPQQQQQQQQQRAWLGGQYGHPTPPTMSYPLPPVSPHALSISPSSPCHHSPSVFSPLAHSAHHHHAHRRHLQLQHGL
ncbi:hypothetical protein CLOP_g19220 [Closterium sp. NIES-67]|nr:hypothetical protein CLOP_g19220 [Closterium sp. NIES-67]